MHKFKYQGPECGEEFEIHSFDFSYNTDSVNGAPAEHGAVASLDIEVQMDSTQNDNGENFNTARTELWTAAKKAISLKGEQLRSKITIVAKQSAQGGGSRKLELEGWCASYNESSHGGPAQANADVLRARFFIYGVKTSEKAGQTGPVLTNA